MLNRWHFIHEPTIWGREWDSLPGDALRYRAYDNRPIRLTQCCTHSNLPGSRFFVYCICIIMLHSHLNGMEIPETKRFIPKGFELGTTVYLAE